MPRKSIRPQTRHHIMVFDDDWDFLLRAFGPSSVRPIGPGIAARGIIHEFVKKARARISETQQSLEEKVDENAN